MILLVYRQSLRSLIRFFFVYFFILKLNEQELERGRKMFEKEGGIPRFYIRILCQLENFLLGVTAEAKKKFSQTNNKAYNTLKQRIKKHNLGFKVEIDQFLENPVDSEAERL